MNLEQQELFAQFKIEFLRELMREIQGDARLSPLTDKISRMLSKAEIERGMLATAQQNTTIHIPV